MIMFMPPFPPRSQDPKKILAELQKLKKDDWDWKTGRSFSLVYFAGKKHQALLEKAFALYQSENALSARAFPSVARIESEVVSMVRNLLAGPKAQPGYSKVRGSFTSGGTESALLALKAYRDSQKNRATHPVIILSRNTHPCHLKAAQYLGLKTVVVDCGPDLRADPKAIAGRIRPNTAAIIASAPSFPHGTLDPIGALGQIALKRKIGLHVDACLGGVALPFLRKLGQPIPAFGFEVPGVTSLALDLHKYGFSAKGASVLLYKNPDLRRHQFFADTQWSGGPFASPGLLGTRSGGNAASAWAALRALGEEGYLGLFEGIMRTTRKLQEGIKAIQGLEILGKPEMSVFAFGSSNPALDIFRVADELEKRKWNLDCLMDPPAIHMVITPVHGPVAGEFLKDLAECVKIAGKYPGVKKRKKTGGAYGTLFAVKPGEGAVEKMVKEMEDKLDQEE